MLKRWAALPQSKRWLIGGIAAVVLVLAIAWLLFVPVADWLADHDVGSATGQLHETALDNARGRVLTLGAGLLAAAALVFTTLNFNLLRRNSESADQWQRRTYGLTEQGQVTDRYTKAIEQLGSKELDVRIGGIYALERIAHDSSRDHPTVMEVLAAFVREHSREQRQTPDPDGKADERYPRPDVQAALTVIGRRDARHDTRPIDLSGADLWGADLRGAYLTGANLHRANLSNSYLGRAHLNAALLGGADLTGANLTDAQLTGARVGGADLTYAHLEGADLTDANLRGANLTNAYLSRAHLIDAHLKDASLAGAWWPEDAAVPEGWQRDTSSGRLKRAGSPQTVQAQISSRMFACAIAIWP